MRIIPKSVRSDVVHQLYVNLLKSSIEKVDAVNQHRRTKMIVNEQEPTPAPSGVHSCTNSSTTSMNELPFSATDNQVYALTELLGDNLRLDSENTDGEPIQTDSFIDPLTTFDQSDDLFSGGFDEQFEEQPVSPVEVGEQNDTPDAPSEPTEEPENLPVTEEISNETEPVSIDQDIKADIDETADTVEIYAGERTPTRKKPRGVLSCQVSLGQLPRLGTSPEQDSELASLLDNYEKRGKLPADEAMRPKLVQFIQREKINAICECKYQRANRMQTLVNKLLLQVTATDMKTDITEKFETLEDKIRVIDQRIAEALAAKKELIQEERDLQKQRRITLKETQREEFDNFEYKWNDPEFLKIFEKPSAGLLHLKKMERSLVLTKAFDQAEQLHRRAVELEKEECAAAQRRAYAEMSKEREKILAKHEQELAVFDQHAKRNVDIIIRNEDIKIRSLMVRKEKLESEMVVMKEKKKKHIRPLIGTMPQVAGARPESVMTPRTAQRYSIYKAQERSPHLTVKPLGNVGNRRRKTTSRTSQSVPATDL